MVEVVDNPRQEPSREPKSLTRLGVVRDGGTRNIIAVYSDATVDEREYWGKWYHDAKSDVMELSSRYLLPFEVCAAVVAILSPGNKWLSNLLAAERLLSWIQMGAPPDRVPVINAYPVNVKKAIDCLQSGSVKYVSGPKVTVFFKSLLDPSSIEDELVLDSHAINIWLGVKRSLKDTPTISSKSRTEMVASYREAARLLGVSVQAVQAVTWYIWKSTVAPEANPPDIRFDVSLFNAVLAANDNERKQRTRSARQR